jgi:hypothetical protein
MENIARVIPFHKKGPGNLFNNYRRDKSPVTTAWAKIYLSPPKF